jgi:hypothetical protein
MWKKDFYSTVYENSLDTKIILFKFTYAWLVNWMPVKVMYTEDLRLI